MQPPSPTASRHSRKRSSIYGNIKDIFKQTIDEEPSPASNFCVNCAETGHWSNDCPNSCTACHTRGHQATDCPRKRACTACSGWGYMRQEPNADATTAVRQLQAAIQSVRRASVQFETSPEGELVQTKAVTRRHDSVQLPPDAVKGLHDELEQIALLADKVAGKVENLDCCKKQEYGTAASSVTWKSDLWSQPE
ncbi:hypothetical protein P153DRAFT_435934 [Dothidotthia symphoricarpi CBS 119687]|uniref:CCHC-type domain-containing protein n=1 Tax=Dothidotthia symphoricarpi CBS 119687 TaxID=1392245 RepID=A0A6A5ZYT0_9PLEO|nr:uncharacterized protein P153DRAFT_435934 [Dothidotthia symphoricarpi CBS 119687]KAF2123471.1 hypothetical protein P153DRAFT_435934 [Dothidotthia symphoricarpi CBS 119687]